MPRGVHTPERESVTVAAAGELWIERCEADGLEESTVRQYRQHLHYHIAPLLGAERLALLSVPRVERFRDELLTERSRAMGRKVLTSLRVSSRKHNAVVWSRRTSLAR